MEPNPGSPEEGAEGTPEQQRKKERKKAIQKNREELAKFIADKVLEETSYTLGELLDLQEQGRPLTRQDLGNRALVLSQQDLEALGFLEIVREDGEITIIDPDDTEFDEEDDLIILPKDLR